MRNAFVLNQDFAPSKVATNAFDANVSYFEAGNLAVMPSIDNYLGAGQVPAADNTASATRMGPMRPCGRWEPSPPKY